MYILAVVPEFGNEVTSDIGKVKGMCTLRLVCCAYTDVTVQHL